MVYIQHYQSEFAGPITEDTILELEEALGNAMDTGNQVGLQTVLESAQNAGILAVQMLALSDTELATRFAAFK